MPRELIILRCSVHRKAVFEERDLIHQFGDRYRLYREQVGMLLPRAGRVRRDDRAAQ